MSRHLSNGLDEFRSSYSVGSAGDFAKNKTTSYECLQIIINNTHTHFNIISLTGYVFYELAKNNLFAFVNHIILYYYIYRFLLR